LILKNHTSCLPRNRSPAGYAAGKPPTAYVNHLAVGEFLPEMPLFLTADRYVKMPLEDVCRGLCGHARLLAGSG